jgi:hypothetical protein
LFSSALARWLIEVGLAIWQALKNIKHRKNPSPKATLSKNCGDIVKSSLPIFYSMAIVF